MTELAHNSPESALRAYAPVRVALHLLALTSLTLAQPTLSVLGSSPELFIARSTQPIEIVTLALGLILVPPLILFLMVQVLGFFSTAIGRGFLVSVVGLLIGQFAMQVLARFGLNAGISIALGLVLGVSGAIAYARFRVFGRYLAFLSISSVVVAFAFLGVGPVSGLVNPERITQPDVPAVSSDASVVFLILDEFPQISLLNENEQIDSVRYPNIARLAEISTWYRSAAPSAPYSTRSISGLLSGRWPDPGALPIAADYPKNLFTALQQTHRLVVTEPVTDLCPREFCEETRQAATREVGDLIGIVSQLHLRLVLPQIFDEAVITLDDPFARRDQINEGLVGNRIELFRDFVQGIDGADRTLYFGHFLLPHAPFHYLPSGTSYNRTSQVIPELDSNGVWSGDAWATFDNHQRHLLQVKALDGLIGELIDHLEELDTLEDTLIVLTSDHGVAHVPFEARRDVTPATLYEVGLVPLFIKAPGQSQGSVDDRPIRGIDVLPTVMDLLGADSSWPGDGESLLTNPGPPELQMRDQNDDVVVIDLEGSGRRQALTLQIDRFGNARGDFDLFAFGPFANLVGSPLADIEVAESDLNAEVNDIDSLLSVDTASRMLPAYIAGTVSGLRDSEEPPHIAIAVNGIVGAVVPLHDVGAGEASFGAVIPESLFADGANQLSLLAVSSQGGQLSVGRIESNTFPVFSIEMIGGEPAFLLSNDQAMYEVSPDAAMGFVDTVVETGARIAVSGWAVEVSSMRPADLVVAFADDRMIGLAEPELTREGLAEELGNDNVLFSGFSIAFPRTLIARTGAQLRLFAISGNSATELTIIDSALADLAAITETSG